MKKTRCKREKRHKRKEKWMKISLCNKTMLSLLLLLLLHVIYVHTKQNIYVDFFIYHRYQPINMVMVVVDGNERKVNLKSVRAYLLPANETIWINYKHRFSLWMTLIPCIMLSLVPMTRCLCHASTSWVVILFDLFNQNHIGVHSPQHTCIRIPQQFL